MNSSVQVKNIVENIKTEFKINITYKQSHKLIFAVFPGTTSRVDHPVKIEAQGGFYSYKGIAAIKQPEALQKEVNVIGRVQARWGSYGEARCKVEFELYVKRQDPTFTAIFFI